MAGDNLIAMLRARLAEVEPETGETFGQRAVESLVNAACAGDLRAVAMIFDRAEGRTPERVQVEDVTPGAKAVFDDILSAATDEELRERRSLLDRIVGRTKHAERFDSVAALQPRTAG